MNTQENTRRFFFACSLLLFAGATVCVDAKIVFRVDSDIYVMNDDGTGRRRLTHNITTKDNYPRWSPDGTKIAFTRYMDKDKIQTSSELFLMNADGTELQRLTHNNVTDHYPSWFPDGTKIAFASNRSGSIEVHVLDLVSDAVTQLTGLADDNRNGGSVAPDWSPDGTQLTFERFLHIKAGLSPKNIYVMSADGQHQRPLLPNPAAGEPLTLRFFPRWSADGQRILFAEVQWLQDGQLEKLIVQRIGRGKQEITDINDRLGNNWVGSGACWMEKDRAILFSLMLKDKATPNYNLYRYTFDTRGLRRITREPSDEDWPDWVEGALSVSPQGKLPTQWGEIKHAAQMKQSR